ncbi:hypothetical protein CHISP_2814 [Chitinispirillum alkaliphilum]|nr:hypothetical protein CHISP_2814 [Chitinispirillum alkaliphilum]
MIKLDQDNFFEELRAAPELPDTIFEKIEPEIKKPLNRFRKFALAASVTLFIGFTSIMISQNNNTRYFADEDIISELQLVHDYLNGNDIDEEFFISSLW